MLKNLHLGARWLFRFSSYGAFFAVFFVIVIIIVNFMLEFDTFGYFGSVLLFLLAFGVLVILVGEAYARLAYKFWKYEFTSTELRIEKGIIWKTYKSIPYKRIQNVDLYRGIIARILGFSTVSIQTAGYSAVTARSMWGARGVAEGNIPAVSIEEGEKIRNFVMARIGKKSGV